jgi:sugar phosphate isomerase/epimerase
MPNCPRPHVISRRAFLGGTACASLAGGLSAWSQDRVTRPGLGFSLYGMRQLDPVAAISLCRAIGYESVEIPVMAGWPCDSLQLDSERSREVGAALRHSGTRLAGLMENLQLLAAEQQHEENLTRLKRAIDLGRAWAPGHTPVVETILGGRPDRWPDDRDVMLRRLETWRDAAQEARGIVAIKPHVAGTVHLPDQALWLVRQLDSPELRLAYDYSHYQLRGEPLEATLERLLPFTAFIHVKDARGTPDRVTFLLPGEGTVDYQRYFEILLERGYSGDVVVEVSGQIHAREGYDPEAAARASYRALDEARARLPSE